MALRMPICPKCFDAQHVERLSQPALCRGVSMPYLCTSPSCGAFVFEGTDEEMAAFVERRNVSRGTEAVA